jgi:hypothetical protein
MKMCVGVCVFFVCFITSPSSSEKKEGLVIATKSSICCTDSAIIFTSGVCMHFWILVFLLQCHVNLIPGGSGWAYAFVCL